MINKTQKTYFLNLYFPFNYDKQIKLISILPASGNLIQDSKFALGVNMGRLIFPHPKKNHNKISILLYIP